MFVDRLCGTHCLRSLANRNCRWIVSKLCWKHTCFVRHMPSSSHSAYVTWLSGLLMSVSYIYSHINRLKFVCSCPMEGLEHLYRLWRDNVRSRSQSQGSNSILASLLLTRAPYNPPITVSVVLLLFNFNISKQ